MRLLDRYLLREFLVVFAYCLAGFFIFWISFEIVSELDQLRADGMGAKQIIRYYAITTPNLLVVVLPVALLLSLLYILTSLARHNEIIAMRNAGLSLWRIALPYLIIGSLCSLALFAINEYWAPRSHEWAFATRYGAADSESPETRSATAKAVSFMSQWEGAREWHIERYNRDATFLQGCQIKWQTEDGYTRFFKAESASWQNGHWSFKTPSLLEAKPGDKNLRPKRLASGESLRNFIEIPETPEQIQSEIRINEVSQRSMIKRPMLSLREIKAYRKLHQSMDSRRRTMIETQYYGRLAEPLTCLVVVLIAIPFGTASGRRNVFAGMAASIGLCFAYFILQRVGMALGTSGAVWPWLGAWLPNLVFSALGLWGVNRFQ